MKRLAKFTVLAASLVILGSSSLNAQIVMLINSSAKTVTFSGSATGYVEPFVLVYAVAWAIPPRAGTFAGNVDITTGVLATGTASPAIGQINIWTPAGGGEMNLVTGGPGSLSISGTGTPTSYAGLSAAGQLELEGWVGSTMVLDMGTGFGDVQVVPEPQEAALLCGLFLAGLAAWRRRECRR